MAALDSAIAHISDGAERGPSTCTGLGAFCCVGSRLRSSIALLRTVFWLSQSHTRSEGRVTGNVVLRGAENVPPTSVVVADSDDQNLQRGEILEIALEVKAWT